MAGELEEGTEDNDFGFLDVDEEQLASEDDFKVERTNDGRIVPVAEDLPGMEKTLIVYPMTDGDRAEFMPPSGRLGDLTSEMKARILKTFCPNADELRDDWGISVPSDYPDFSEASATDLEDEFSAFADPEVIVQAVLNASGFEVRQRITEEAGEGKFDELLEELVEKMEAEESEESSTSD